jgi:hypothetical protein
VSCASYAKHIHLISLCVPHVSLGGLELPTTGAAHGRSGRRCSWSAGLTPATGASLVAAASATTQRLSMPPPIPPNPAAPPTPAAPPPPRPPVYMFDTIEPLLVEDAMEAIQAIMQNPHVLKVRPEGVGLGDKMNLQAAVQSTRQVPRTAGRVKPRPPAAPPSTLPRPPPRRSATARSSGWG